MSTTDQRVARYLQDRSSTIDLPHAGIDVITRRARRHRRRRTAALGGAVTAVLLGGTAVVLGAAPEDGVTSTTGTAASVVPSPLEWSVVPSGAGLGWSGAATSDGSAVYSLSTAAPTGAGDGLDDPARLYRSTDGTEWADVGLPDGLYATSLAGGDGTVYAVGTAAAGGGAVGVEVAASTDGGEGWDTAPVPLDLAALSEGFPGEVRVVGAEVAVADGTTVVAVSTRGEVDVDEVLRGEDASGWFQEPGGLVRPDGTSCTEGAEPAPAETTAPGAASDPPATMAPSTSGPSTTSPEEPEASGASRCRGEQPLYETRSWAELGLAPDAAAVADGQTHVFVSDAEGTLVPGEALPGATFADSPGASRLLAADDGFWMVVAVARTEGPAADGTFTDQVLWHSADGAAWTSSPLPVDGSLIDAGVADGRPILVGMDHGHGSRVVVHRVEAGGATTEVDLSRLLDLDEMSGVSASAVGPMGVALVVTSQEDPADGQVVVHSPDGLAFSTQELPQAAPGTRQTVNGITITPDAIKVRLNVRDEDDPWDGAPRDQRLFVGTPTG